MFRPALIPKDSIVHHFLASQRITEVPLSYQVVTCLSAIGCLLKRQVWCDQVEWCVYPNLSVLLVGPSGIGKDVAINKAKSIVDEYDPALAIGGKTMESIQEQLLNVGDPACAFVAAQELTAFLGSKDYQKSMAQELTDLLSTGESVNISLKSAPGVKRLIKHPTVTVQAGSTEEWLHRAMPDGSLEGGLFPRFIIVCEEYGNKNIPLLKYSISVEDRKTAEKGGHDFKAGVATILDRYVKPSEIVPLSDAIEYYERWYINRFKYFSATVRPYANRSRDQVLRLAMLMGISRGHNYMEEADMKFATAMMGYVARSIDKAASPPSLEAQIAKTILTLLPSKLSTITLALGRKYSRKDILEGIELLRATGQIREAKVDGAVMWVANSEVESSW